MLRSAVEAARRPPHETHDHYLVLAELPGAKRDEVEVTVANGRLVIWGERPRPEENHEIFRRLERRYGWFLRQFNLPANADLTTVEATFRDGILEIAIPKLDRRSLLSLEPY
jgi:HSP20 family protein